ncbi:tachylectin-related carbohydrate-binding protein [Streptomyces sp. NPDC045470]|uniref:tachylectin-related carbohydrate-binding protein n=1 Tax=unclassified Streptomyces TaxID=2593676 RepID=UPI003408234D
MLRMQRIRRRFRPALIAAAVAASLALPLAAAGPAAASAQPRPASERTAMYARDHDGVLWQYEGTGWTVPPFRPRARIGGGWDEYVQITSLGGTSADGTGDVAAVDRSGKLYFYEGSGDPSAPFKSRQAIGYGWDRYISITGAGDANNDGKNDLVARDTDGGLYFYAGTGKPSAPFAPPVRVGGGWQVYDHLTTFGNGLLARDTDGVLWKYQATGSSDPSRPFESRARVGGGWNIYADFVGIRDLDGDQLPDLTARDLDGNLSVYEGMRYQGGIVPNKAIPVDGGWNIYDLLF